MITSLQDVEMIVLDGYYLKGQEEIKPNPHTKETLELYEKGYEVSLEQLRNEDMYEGIVIEDGKILAQCYLTHSQNLADYICIN